MDSQFGPKLHAVDSSRRSSSDEEPLVLSEQDHKSAQHIITQHARPTSLQPTQQQTSSHLPPLDFSTAPTPISEAPSILSPFYTHPPVSFEKEESKSTVSTVSTAELPLHYIRTATPNEKASGITSFTSITLNRTRDCDMWPNQQTLSKRQTQNRKRRMCGWTDKISKKMKVCLILASLAVVVGVAVALGVTISKATNNGYYAGAGQSNKPIGGS